MKTQEQRIEDGTVHGEFAQVSREEAGKPTPMKEGEYEGSHSRPVG